MDRFEAAEYLKKMALATELLGESSFRSAAFRKAAQTLETITDDTWSLWLQRGKPALPGIGDGIARRLNELARTGTAADLDAMLLRIPPGLMDILRIRGLGVQRVRTLWQEASIVTLGQLRRASKQGRIASLPGFGKGIEVQIEHEIRQLRRSRGHWLRSGALREAPQKEEQLRKTEGLLELALAGEIRRARATVNEIVWVAAAKDPRLFLDRLATLKGAALAEGGNSGIVRFAPAEGPPQSVIVVDRAHFAARLFLATGSRAHTRSVLHRLASKSAAGKAAPGDWPEDWLPHSEEEIYERAGMTFVPPELREGRGEITAAGNGTLPELIQTADLQGIFHVHTTWSDGRASIAQMAEEVQRLGWRYVGIADHSQAAFYAHGLFPERLIKQGQEIRKLQDGLPDVKIFHGVECDIRPDGSLDYEDSVLAQLDYVIVSIHSVTRMDRESMTRRVIRAIRHPSATMLAHPSGRLLLEREAYQLDWDQIFQAAADTGTAIEFNTTPERYDLDWRLIRKATSQGIRISINPDAHRLEMLQNVFEGIRTARKGWLTAEQVLNTRSAEELEEEFRGATHGRE